MTLDAIAIVPLGKERYAIIDASDKELVEGRNWSFMKTSKHSAYAVANVPNGKGGFTHLHLHRLLLDAPAGLEVDHINGNGLDNRRENLRLATRRQNASNKRPLNAKTTGYKGVSFHKDTSKWQARLQVPDRPKHLGLFEDIFDAVLAYDEACIGYFGAFAHPNYPAAAYGLGSWSEEVS